MNKETGKLQREKKRSKMVNKYIKRYSTSPLSRKIKVKIAKGNKIKDQCANLYSND